MGERFFVFQLVDEETTNRLISAETREETLKLFVGVVTNYLRFLKDTEEDIDFRYKRDIVLDLLYSSLVFAKEQDFSVEKTSCVIELVFRVFQVSMKSVLSFEKSFDLCKSYLMRHALFRPPHSIILFTLDDIKAILGYFRKHFLRNYSMLLKAFTPQMHYEVETFTMFKKSLPPLENLQDGEYIDKDEFSVLDMFNKDKEIKLSKEELDEIMRGNSIHNIPEWKRQEIIRKQNELKKQEKIDRILQKELAKLQQHFDQEIGRQDEEFEKKLSEIKPKK